jgi:hypothetical protein
MFIRRRLARKSSVLAICASLYLSALGCLPSSDQFINSLYNASEAFVLEWGASVIETIFGNYDD